MAILATNGGPSQPRNGPGRGCDMRRLYGIQRLAFGVPGATQPSVAAKKEYYITVRHLVDSGTTAYVGDRSDGITCCDGCDGHRGAGCFSRSITAMQRFSK